MSLAPRWSESDVSEARLPLEALAEGGVKAAQALLGCRLISTVGGERTAGVVVEVEAYGGRDDPASHAATRHGVTQRNRVMFGPPGRAYVYRSYGVHWCMNVVTGPEGEAEAVLIRGIEPVEGIAVMARRRGGSTLLGAGPGRLAEALGITGDLDGHDLRGEPLQLVTGWRVPAGRVGVSRRVGVSAATDWPYRFFVRDSIGLSRPDGWGASSPQEGSTSSTRG